MKLNKYSRNRLMETFAKWDVPKDFADPFYNYLVYGYSPGGCFTSVLANDFAGAIGSSHPANTVEAFKALASWIHDYVPVQAHGSYQAVEDWTTMDQDKRRTVLENFGLIYSKEEEIIQVLAGETTYEPVLY